jgi:hypothetical protein
VLWNLVRIGRKDGAEALRMLDVRRERNNKY